MAAASREQFYVSASRARLSVHIYTDDRAELARAVTRSGERVAASDVVARAEDTRPRLQERVKAKAVELATRLRRELFTKEGADGERAGVALLGWPSREREPEAAR